MRTLWQRLRQPTFARPAVGLALFVGALSATASGGIGTLIIFSLGAMVLTAVGRRIGGPEHGNFALAVALVAYGVRSLGAIVLHRMLLGSNPYGAMFLDDAGYTQIATALAASWHGTAPNPYIDPSLDHYYIRMAAGIMWMVGPEIVAVKIANTVLSILTAFFLYGSMTAARVPGSRVALAAVLVFPSLALWSALALKDSFVLCFAACVVWSVAKTIRTSDWRWLLLTIGALLAIESVRPYLFVIMTIAWPAALALSPTRRHRLKTSVSALVAAMILIVATDALTYLNPQIITAPAYIRMAMAAGARSGFIEPLPLIRAELCSEFVVTISSRTPVPSPRTINIDPGTDVQITGSGSKREAAVLVDPGDLVIVNGNCPPHAVTTPVPGATSGNAPAPTPIPLALSPVAPNIVSTPAPVITESVALSGSLVDNILHLPMGFAFLIGSPFPWDLHSLREAAVLPEMLAWYLTFAGGVVGLWYVFRERRWRELAYPLAVAAGVSIVLSLIEGNTGTLLRHRAMLIPWVVMLASFALSRIASRERDA